MANTDSPRGFHPIRHLCGGEIRTNPYVMTASATVYPGDVIKIVADGTVEGAAADIGTAAIGIAAEYKAASSTAGATKLEVYDDPYIIFEVQADTGTVLTQAAIGNTANHVATAGSATDKMSRQELDSSDVGTGAQFKILRLVDRAGNTMAEHGKFEVVFNEHHYKAAVAGV